MVFVAVWTLLVLIYLGLAPKFFSRFAHVHAILALDALTMLFWFAGFIALAVLYHDIVDVANFEYFTGCGALGDYCGVSEAAVVFGAFEWYVPKFFSAGWGQQLGWGTKETRIPKSLLLLSSPMDARYLSPMLTQYILPGHFSLPLPSSLRWTRAAAAASMIPSPQSHQLLPKKVIMKK